MPNFQSVHAYRLSRQILEGPARTFVYVAQNAKDALSFKRDLEFFLGPFAPGETLFFPPYDVLPFSNLSPHNDLLCQRLRVLHALRQNPPPAFIATTASAILPALPPREILEKTIPLRVGEEIDLDVFCKTLVDWGYQRVPLVIDGGNFAVRGGLVDLFCPLYPHPLRIEWMGDTIESLRVFDTKTQKSIKSLEEIQIIPVREVVLTEATIKTFSEKIRNWAEEKDLTRSDWFPMVEKVRQKIFFPGIESYLPYFYETTTTFQDCLPSGAENISPTNQPQSGVEGGAPRAWPVEGATRAPMIEKSSKTAEPLSPLVSRIQEWSLTDQVTLVAGSRLQAERLSDLLSPHFEKKPSIVVGDLSSGFRLPEERITYITDEEIFGPRTKGRSKETVSEMSFSSFGEMKIGDPIVHKEYGIGLYQGMISMKIENCRNDFLLITYQGGDKLYLPVYRLNLVQRYTGSEGTPRLDKMGGASWAKLKGKAEKIIRKLAGELLNLYAARTAGQGFAFSPPNELFEAFEAGFPYEETPDQENAIHEVLQDMQKSKSSGPMDRLVLGDVGYGKTEVALRAAFKAAIDGKQTAFLVPTTLLAFQHHERFVERFKDYPVNVEMISRFRSVAEQKKILKETAEGKIDILIGTHRLLQPDVSFKDLGLLVVDEEHRFGVEHKEKMKRLRKDVDVLALSATPIPRTLYMSLVGIRKISVIETPPTDRLAIRTFVMPFQEEVIREAILREIKRGGQVFFVHNEVSTIGKMKEELLCMIPDLKIAIGHGQMEEKALEEVMIRFYHRDFDVLLCTTIIESGIDIPTANTILINKANEFGLAQIYQLRGRVGRGSHRAYAYLLADDGVGASGGRPLTKEATQRLSALQRFSELGSGYKMATYDLEIRGAGNLLGTEQAGQITAIGYELYTELMEKAVRELKGETVLQEIDPELHFRISAYIPEDYVPDPPVRLELYRRLSSLDREEEAEAIEDELRDRFGSLPPEVGNLLELSAIQALAKKLRIKQIRYDGKHFMYAFDPTAFRLAPAKPDARLESGGESRFSSPIPPIGATSPEEKLQAGDLLTELLIQKIKKEPKTYRLTSDFRFTVNKAIPQETLALAETKKFLRELILNIDNY